MAKKKLHPGYVLANQRQVELQQAADRASATRTDIFKAHGYVLQTRKELQDITTDPSLAPIVRIALASVTARLLAAERHMNWGYVASYDDQQTKEPLKTN
jgi:hypothetical protein